MCSSDLFRSCCLDTDREIEKKAENMMDLTSDSLLIIGRLPSSASPHLIFSLSCFSISYSIFFSISFASSFTLTLTIPFSLFLSLSFSLSLSLSVSVSVSVSLSQPISPFLNVPLSLYLSISPSLSFLSLSSSFCRT